MRPRPIFVLHSCSAPISLHMILPLFLFLSPYLLSFGVYATASSPPIRPLLSFPTHTPSSMCSVFIHSFIFYCLNGNRQSFHRAGALPHYNLSLCFYLHSSSFPSSGDFTFISSSFTLHSSLSLCVLVPSCLFIFFPRSCAPHCSPSPPPQFALSSFFISLSLSALFLSVSRDEV